MSKVPKILYIDDEVDLVQLASSFFEDEDFPFETSTSFDEALSKIRGNHYDLIISDSKMPSGTGEELLSIVRSEGSFDGKFILVTGNLDYQEGREDFDKVIHKPIRFEELIDVIKSMS
jgi:two-component system, chemotaxis family, sensor kinase CheA